MTVLDARATRRQQRTTPSKWLSLVILCVGFLMIVVDVTIVNVALPSIRRDLGFSQADLAWVVNAYLIAFGGFLLLAGRLGDLIGRKRVFLIGLGIFTTASVLCGLSCSQPVLIAARSAQGFGGVAALLLATFIWRQATARNPLLPLRIFRSRNLSGANVIQPSMMAGMFGFFFLGSLDLQRILHYGPLAIGLAFLPNALAMAALSVGASARLIMRFGARSVLLGGQLLIAVSLVLLAVGPTSPQYLRDWLVPMVLLGIGAGLAFPALTILAMADATPSDSGLASGVLNTTTQVGSALGLAVLATLSTNRTTQLMAAGNRAVSALSGGYHFAWAIGAGLVIASIVLAAVLLRSQPVADPESAVTEEEACA